MKNALFLTTHTVNNEVFWKSLQCVGWNVTPHRYDDRPRDRHIELIGTARDLSPDVIAYVGALETHGVSNPIPSHDVLRKLRDVAPTVILVGDAAIPEWQPQIADFQQHECFDVYVGIDGHGPQGLMAKLTPIDVRPYHPRAWEERDVFVGSNKGPGEGGERGAVIDVVHAAMPGTVSSDDMAAFLCRCKVVPNGPASGHPGYDHVKGRVVEAGFAGACLLERRNAVTSQWFKPGLDYVEYEHVGDAPARLDWIRNHDDEARQIAASLNKQMHMYHHPRIFWRDVLERVGIEV